MKTNTLVLLVALFLLSLQIEAQQYKDYVSDEVTSETFTYSDTLNLDFYSSEENITSKRPLLILVHGGGFSSGKRDNPLEKKFCIDMARRGYAVASMSYNLTRKGKSFGCDYSSVGKMVTFNSVTKDILNATSFLTDKASTLNFNANKIILVGSSAGAEAVLNTVYMQGSPKTKDVPFGAVKYAGVVSFAGALVSTDYITEKNVIPSIFFHGKKDNLVPYYIAPHHYCKPTSPGFITLFGAKAITDKLNKLGGSYLLATDPEGNHDWANLAYNYTDEIAGFISETIVNKKHIVSNIQVSSKK